ncbi:MAG: radical SAM protein [Candidatus Bathyarchaeota archaeon]|nr:radical SAM protein [Candidatus Bathyarchaeota archaeon]
MPLTPQDIWNLNETDLLTMLNSNTPKPKKNTIHFYAPTFTYYKNRHYYPTANAFPTISLTGTTCALNCKHCSGKVLQTMHPAHTPQQLIAVATKLKEKGAVGCLISGGCTTDGTVPLDKFIPAITHIKHELKLTVFVHTGIIKPTTANALKQADVDAALIDIIGSQQTIHTTYNLNISTEDYEQSLQTLNQAKLPFAPHVIVGLNQGKLDGEQKALQMIRQVEPAALVIIAFMPIHGTPMENTPPPKPTDIAKVIALARQMFPITPLILGCMRPKGKNRSETDVLALKAGVDAIAFPSDTAIEYVKNHGYNTVFSSYCCAQMYLDALH